MATPSDDPADYDFDIAVSFAGENRQYVEDLVRAVNVDGLRVFYDADYKYDLWGEDNVEYFADVYGKRSRFVAMFISKHYAEKEWTRLERRTSLARAMTQRSAYILPIRLDDTELDGLLPTVGYLEAVREGVEGIAAAIRHKVGSAKATGSGYHGRVARTPDEIQALIAEKTPAWEYVLYASILVQGRDALANQKLDNDIGYAQANGQRVDTAEAAIAVATSVLNNFEQTADQFNKVLEPSAFRAAFGEPGVTGDPDRILHLGQRFISVYERFLQIGTEVRGIGSPSQYRPVLDLAADLNKRPIEDLDKFIDYFVPLMDGLAEKLLTGENINLDLVVHLSTDEDAMTAMTDEIRRISEQ